MLALLAPVGAAPSHGEVPGQIVVDPAHPQWFGRPDGSPFFMCGPGDPEWFLYQGTRLSDGTRDGGGQSQQIQRLIDEGGNSIYLTAVRSHGGDGDSTQNPFSGSSPSNALDDDILDQWEGWFTQMDEGGVTIFFVFYDDGSCIWDCNKSSDHTVPAAEQAFVEALVNRFEHHANLIWVVAEEYMEAYSAARISNIAAVIRAEDDHDHAIASTELTGLVFDHADDPALDVFGIQCQEPGGASCDLDTTPAEVNEAMNIAWDNAAGRYNMVHAEIRWDGLGEGQRARQIMWATAMGGAYFLANGWDLTGPDDPPDSNLNECRWLQQFFEGTRLPVLAPDNSRADGDTAYVMAGEAERAYVLYTESYSGGMGLTSLPAGQYLLHWLDTASGATSDELFDHPATGTATFIAPTGLGPAIEIALSIDCEDADSDGVCAGPDNCPGLANPDQADADSDGAGDDCDPCPFTAEDDLDGDGLCGDADNCPDVANPEQADADDDGVGDDCDNCPAAANADQSDGDTDGTGDVCDVCPADPDDDADADGVCAGTDNCPMTYNPDQADADSNGYGDACPLRTDGAYINEVQYDQEPDGQEFIEIYAVLGPVDVTGWELTDQDEMSLVFGSSDPDFPCAEPFILFPGDRVIVWHGAGTAVCEGPVREIHLDGGPFLQRAGDDLLLRAGDGSCRDYLAYESASSVDGPPADCAWDGQNPTNGDQTGVSLSRFDGYPFTDEDSGTDWEASGDAATLGPASPGAMNEIFSDIDGDGVADRRDNCPADANSSQADLDADLEGDRCDIDDTMLNLAFDVIDRIDWDLELGFDSWNLYRGDLAELRDGGAYTQAPGSNTLALRGCDLAQPWQLDGDTPVAGSTALYPVSGNTAGVEGSLGQDGDGFDRPNTDPCP